MDEERGRRLEVSIRQQAGEQVEHKLDGKEDKNVEELVKAGDQEDGKGMVIEIDQIIEPREEKISKIGDSNGEEDTKES